jgi:hypothetical protein
MTFQMEISFRWRFLMDAISLREERARVSNTLRAKLETLASLRSRLANAKTDEGRRLLYNVVDKEADACRRLGAKLIELDDMISAVRSREQAPPARNGRLRTAPLDF